ncbi:MAG TPA: uroporphyrinogen-III synthase, partial [Geminicoccaceae bacterium]|nr:uroporphyrinogen-III synthase [Geminicoccaceae bacterium]
ADRGAVREGSGDGAGLATLVAAALPPGAAVLHLAGEDVREGVEEGLAARGLVYRRRVVYRALPATDLAPATVAALAEWRLGAALFFSPRSAGHWAALVERRGLQDVLAGTAAVCLSEAVAAPLRGLGWRRVEVAPRRDQTALIDCLEGPR